MGKRVIRGFYRPSWKDHLTFTLRERRGFLVLFSLLSIEVSVLYYLRQRSVPISREQWSEMVAIADSMLSLTGKNNVSGYGRNRGRVPDTLFVFDPNECSLEQWKSLGLTERQAGSVMKYRSNGGVFRSKSDLKRMRSLPSDLVESWMPFIALPDSAFKKKDYQRIGSAFSIDINTADSISLDRLKGVSPFMAVRIIRYREALGGFVSKSQLSEVYGMSDSVYSYVEKLSDCSVVQIRRLDLNTSPWDSLKRHPYVGYRLAGMIDRYRRQHPFNRTDELLSIPLVTPEIFRKLAPYLKVE